MSLVSREPRHVDREVSKLPAYGGSSPKTQWKQAKPERLKLQQTHRYNQLVKADGAFIVTLALAPLDHFTSRTPYQSGATAGSPVR
jgi:hypothetical protein